MAQSTAGKGPGIVLRAQNHSGAVRVSLPEGSGQRGLLELLDGSGRTVEVGLTAEELRTLGRVLRQVALALGARSLSDEVTRR